MGTLSSLPWTKCDLILIPRVQALKTFFVSPFLLRLCTVCLSAASRRRRLCTSTPDGLVSPKRFTTDTLPP